VLSSDAVDEHSEICVELATLSPQASELKKKDENQVFPLNVDIEVVFAKFLDEQRDDTVNFVFDNKYDAFKTLTQITNPLGLATAVGGAAWNYVQKNWGTLIDAVFQEGWLCVAHFAEIRDVLDFINSLNLPTNPRVFFTKLMLEMLMFQFGYQSVSAFDKETIRTNFVEALKIIKKDQTETNLLVGDIDDAESKIKKYEETLGDKRFLTFDDFARVCLVRDSDMMQAIDMIKRDVPNFDVGDRRQIRKMFSVQSSEIKCVISTLFYAGSKNQNSCAESCERRRLLRVLQKKLSYIQKIYNQVQLDRDTRETVFQYSRFNRVPLSGSADAHLMRLERQIHPDSPFITNADKWRSTQLFGSVHYIFHHEVFTHLLKCFVRSPWATAPKKIGIIRYPKELSEFKRIALSSWEQLKETLSAPVQLTTWNPMEGFVELTHARNRLLLNCDSDWVTFQQNQVAINEAVDPLLNFMKKSMDGLEPLLLEHIFKPFVTQPFLRFIKEKVNSSHIVQFALCLRDASELAVFSFNEMLPLMSYGIKPIFEASHVHENMGFTHSNVFCRLS
jgi:hypothetical protein